MTMDDINRRNLLKASMLPLAMAGAQTLLASGASAQVADSGRSAVVYLSRTGNTRVLAGALARQFGADLFELHPRDPWPADYEDMVDWASRMQAQAEPLPLAEKFDLSGHGTVFLGFPIWGMALPAPMASFLTSHDLSSKTVLPFITHGGYGVGNAVETVRGLALDARFAEAFVLECDQERSTLNSLASWLTEMRDQLPG